MHRRVHVQHDHPLLLELLPRLVGDLQVILLTEDEAIFLAAELQRIHTWQGTEEGIAELLGQFLDLPVRVRASRGERVRQESGPFDMEWSASDDRTPPEGLRATMETPLGDAAEKGLVEDATIADSIAQARAFWCIREFLPDAQKPEGGSIKHDVSVPVAKVPQFLAEADAACERLIPGIRPVPFGHMGDGNIHFNLQQPEGEDPNVFMKEGPRITKAVHDLAVALEGSFTAEHGIGALKRKDLYAYKTEVEIELMKSLKKALDPKGIMNPGKVI